MIIKKLIKNHEIDILRDLQRIVHIRSVYDESTVSEENPYGKPIGEAFSWLMNKAKMEGFKVKNFRNKMGSILIHREQPKYSAAICHLDVVPASGKWRYEMFDGKISNGFMWGRGTQDDKGPAIATYWAMKFARKILGKDNIQKDFRLMIGTNEERGMDDLKEFVKSAELKPYFSITPDAMFPGIYAEKHMCDIELVWEKPQWLSSLEGGEAMNMIMGEATVWTTEGKNFVRKGITGHGSTPQVGENAVTKMFHEELKRKEGEFADFMRSCHEDFSAKVLGLEYVDEKLGITSSNIGIIQTIENEVMVKFNVRVPPSVDWDKFNKDIDNIVNRIPGVKNIIKHNSSKGYIRNLDSDEFKILLDSYREVTNDYESKFTSIGGGTYARYMDNCVPYGIIMPNSAEYFHQIDERINLEDLNTSIEILTNVIIKLVK